MSKSKEFTPTTVVEANASHDATPKSAVAGITLAWGTESIEVVPGSDMHRIAVRGGYHLPSERFVCEDEIVPCVPMFSKTGTLVHVGHLASTPGQTLTVSDGNGGTSTIPQSALHIGREKQLPVVWITAAAAVDAKLSPVAFINRKQQ